MDNVVPKDIFLTFDFGQIWNEEKSIYELGDGMEVRESGHGSLINGT